MLTTTSSALRFALSAVLVMAAVALNVPTPPPHRLFRCVCGEVEIKLKGEPFLINNCHCTACIQV